MAYTAAGLKAAVDGIAAAGAYISIHESDPGLTGAGELTGGTYARVQTTWAAAVNAAGPPASSSRTGSQVPVNVPAGKTARFWGINSAATGGTFIYGGALAADEAFGAAGVLNHTPIIVIANPA